MTLFFLLTVAAIAVSAIGYGLIRFCRDLEEVEIGKFGS